MKASEMKTLTEYNRIIDQAKNRAISGMNQCDIYGKISEQTIFKLRSEGYDVELNPFSEIDDLFKISW